MGNLKTFKLIHGVPFGKGEETEMQYDVELRELSTADMLAAEEAAEVLKIAPDGTPFLVSSPARMGAEIYRRSVAKIGVIDGLSMKELKALHTDDFRLIRQHVDAYEAAKLNRELVNKGR